MKIRIRLSSFTEWLATKTVDSYRISKNKKKVVVEKGDVKEVWTSEDTFEVDEI